MNRRSKKRMASVIGMGLMLASVCVTAGTPGISLKLDGGLSKFRIGDTNTNITELVRNWENVAGQRGSPLLEKLGKIGSGMEGEAEIRLNIRPFLAVGLGFGRILVEKKGNRMEIALPPPIRHQIQTQDNEISAMPVFANLYYLRPVFPSATLFARLGAGVYITKWWEKARYDEETSEKAPWWREWELDAKANGLGFNGGIGLEYSLIRRLSSSASCGRLALPLHIGPPGHATTAMHPGCCQGGGIPNTPDAPSDLTSLKRPVVSG